MVFSGVVEDISRRQCQDCMFYAFGSSSNRCDLGEVAVPIRYESHSATDRYENFCVMSALNDPSFGSSHV